MKLKDLLDGFFEDVIGIRVPKFRIKSGVKPLKQNTPAKEIPRQHIRHFKMVPGKKN